ncbi:hypothetical protein QL093DRAFT_2570403 [Fusarium oxysporum]|nr:hypothetical protein QL093DRAFT_2570403 [Fusarium oxysporum]
MFQVKWEGFDSKNDLTWEPEDNLKDKIFEESDRAAKTKKRRRMTNGTFSKMPNPPPGSWEDEIETIDACEEDNNGKLIVYLIWKNGQKTKHEAQIIYNKCPQKVVHPFVTPLACQFLC